MSEASKIFTGTKDTDLLIMSKLNDTDLFTICLEIGSKNRYVHKLCENEDFWRNRYFYVFGETALRKKSWKIQYIKRVKYIMDSLNKANIGPNWMKRKIFNNVKNPTEDMQLAAVSKNAFILEIFKNPSEKVQIEAVKQHGIAILYILGQGIIPSEEVQLAALRQDPRTISFLENRGIIPSERMKNLIGDI